MERFRNPDLLMKLKNMILNFRVAELQTLLQRAQMNKTGKKNILQERALSLLNSVSEEMVELISELYRQRYSSVKSCNFSRGRIETNPIRTFQDSTIRAQSLNVNHHASTYRRMHPYAACDPPKYRPMKGLESRPYAYGNPNNMYFQNAVQSTPFPPSYEKLLRDADCPKLTPSSFFDIIHKIEKQYVFVPKKFPQREEVDYSFMLPLEVVNLMAKSRTLCLKTNTYISDYIVQLRVSKVNEPDDFLPVTLSVSCNGSKVALPSLVPVGKSSGQMKRPCVPLDVTAGIRLTPKRKNMVAITWDKEDHRNYACILGISLYIVRQVTADELVQRLIAGVAITEHESLSMVMEKFKGNAEDDIAATTLRASAMCPLGKMLIKTPCRATSCTHVQCFDGEIFVKMNEKKPTWICPVCDKRVSFADIKIDQLWNKILKSVPEDSKEIEFSNDGTWQFVRAEVKKPVSKKRVREPEILIIDDSDDDSSNQMVIDISDDDDDDIECTFVSPNILKSNCDANVSEVTSPQALFINVGASTSSNLSNGLNPYGIANSGTRHSQFQQSGIPSAFTYTLSDDDDE